MFSKRFKGNPERILIVSLSNVGDVYLTAPVVSVVRKRFPSAEVTLLVGPAAKEVFKEDPRLQEIVAYDKKAPFSEKWRFVRSLRKRKFDLVVDLRNTLFPLLLGVPIHTRLFSQAPPLHLLHKMDRHLWKLTSLGIPVDGWQEEVLYIQPASEEGSRKLLDRLGLRGKEPFVLMSAGSKSLLKRWRASSYAELSDRLQKEKALPVVFIGEKNDTPFVDTIATFAKGRFRSLVGQTSLPDLVALIRSAKLLVTNDSASLHIASLLGTPTVALFGPTDPRKYGPRSAKSRVVRKALFCSPCEKAECPYHHECMEELSSEEVYQACCEILEGHFQNRPQNQAGRF